MDEMLRVKLGALTECAREMQSALEEYEAAVNEAQSAAQALGDEWKGAARRLCGRAGARLSGARHAGKRDSPNAARRKGRHRKLSRDGE